MRKFCLILLLLTSLLTGCKSVISPDLQVAQAGKAFSIQVPSNLIPVDDLHDVAPLQYADEQQGLYLIGLYESKSEMETMQLRYTLEDYSWFVQNLMALGLDTTHVNQHEQLFINGLGAETVELFGAKEAPEGSLETWMRICVLESPTHFYQLIGWTSRDLRDAYRTALEDIECSFAELAPVPDQEASEPGGAESSTGRP
jgi:hypothetical protein